MKRTAPMKRTGFARWTPKPARQMDYQPRPRAPALRMPDTRDRMTAPVPKDQPLQHAGYMRLVRLLPCAMCGRAGPSQFCHSDEGKGMGLKTDCRLGWPGCGPHDGRPGCHWFVGTSGRMGKAARREFEAKAARLTRQEIVDRGLWPASLPMLIEEVECPAL